MQSSFALIEGNLALAPETAAHAAGAPRYQTDVVEFRRRPLAERGDGPKAAPAIRWASHAVTFIVLAALVVSVLSAAWFMLDRADRSFDEALSSAPRQSVVVTPGASLWSLAEEYGIDGLSTQQTSDVIRSWNGLSTSALQPGDVLVVPLP